MDFNLPEAGSGISPLLIAIFSGITPAIVCLAK
jgi:hypothetical protein